jgi:tetraacyldisaccharide 4'-kinase
MDLLLLSAALRGPSSFSRGLKDGLQLAVRIAFPDHHRYTQADIERLQAAARSSNAGTLITTEKDRVRMGKLAEEFSKALGLDTARLSISIEDESSIIDSLLTSIQRL